jgi:hypothetical protein
VGCTPVSKITALPLGIPHANKKAADQTIAGEKNEIIHWMGDGWTSAEFATYFSKSQLIRFD